VTDRDGTDGSVADWDVAVVGAGIAGLTAAQTSAAHGLRVTALDQLAPGGQLINLGELVHYPGLPGKTTGPDLAGSLLEAAMTAGVEIGYAEVTRVTGGVPRAVVVATGLTPGRVEVPGAKAWAGRGLSECASCDGPLFAGQRVVVVGDDEWAALEAAELAAFAAHVTVLVPGEPRWSAGATQRLSARAGVEVRVDAQVTGLAGDGSLTGVTLAGGGDVEATGVFAYTGKAARSAFLDAAFDSTALHRSASGSIDGDPATAVPGLFVAGDVRTGSTPYLVGAAADGLRAGLAAAAFLTR
jgi:thioredoxin reductase (NADPH)